MNNGIFINDDYWNFYWDAPFEDMNEAGLKKAIDFYTGRGGVRGLIFNLNGSRSNFESKVLDNVWKCVEYHDDGSVWYHGERQSDAIAKAMRNLREMYCNVKDPTLVRREYCRSRGVEFFFSMRTNDMHVVFKNGQNYNRDCVLLDSFLTSHDDYKRCLYRRGRSGRWADECLDYGIKEVRDRYLALAAEYLAYDPDGFELDFMRHLPIFRPGFDELGIPLMNDFMREIRRMADAAEKRSGHKVQIAVRVPTTPEDAFACGFDVAAWADDGLVDIVVPSPSFSSNESEIPLEIWRRMLPKSVTLAPCIELHNHPGIGEVPMMKTTKEIDCGFASIFYYKGADTVYLYNHFPYGSDKFENDDDERELFRILGDRETVEKSARRHWNTFRDFGYIEGRPWGGTFKPWALPPKGISTVRINVGGGTSGREARLILAFHDGDVPSEIRLNTVILSAETAPSRPFPQMPKCDILKPVSFPIPAGVLHDGHNLVEFYCDSEKSVRLMWLEIQLLR